MFPLIKLPLDPVHESGPVKPWAPVAAPDDSMETTRDKTASVVYPLGHIYLSIYNIHIYIYNVHTYMYIYNYMYNCIYILHICGCQDIHVCSVVSCSAINTCLYIYANDGLPK